VLLNAKTDILLKETKTTFVLGSASILQSYNFLLTSPSGTFYIVYIADITLVINKTDDNDDIKFV